MSSNSEERSLDWLLEPGDIGVKYLALRDLLDTGAAELSTVQKLAHSEGPIATVLSKMQKA